MISRLLTLLTCSLAALAGGSDLPEDALCVMSYNLRYASTTPPNAWPDRKPLMCECLKQYRPDLIGTQEGLYSQLKDLARELPEYDWIGLGRDGGSRGEFMAVFYRKERLDPLAYDHFWLSDRPREIGSSTWGNSNRRMVTWVLFLDRKTNRRFYFFNTHLDHEIQPAREKSAELILQRVAELKTNLPVILTGDFNAAAGKNRVYELLVREEAFADTWELAREKRNGEFGTFNGFRGLPRGGERIDWILVRGSFEVFASEIVTFAREGRFPSDHLPVVSWLRLRPEAGP